MFTNNNIKVVIQMHAFLFDLYINSKHFLQSLQFLREYDSFTSHFGSLSVAQIFFARQVRIYSYIFLVLVLIFDLRGIAHFNFQVKIFKFSQGRNSALYDQQSNWKYIIILPILVRCNRT